MSERIVGVQAQAISQTPDDFSSQLGRASKALNDANVAMYPVDYQGLGGSYPEVMMRLADATGGTVAYRTNDLTGAVRAAVADGDVSYTLGFYPTDERDFRVHDEEKVAAPVCNPEIPVVFHDSSPMIIRVLDVFAEHHIRRRHIR